MVTGIERMQIEQIINQLQRHGFSRTVVTGQYVSVMLKLQQGEAYAVCLVECDYFADLNVSGYENMLRGIRSSLYRYDFTEVHLLSVLYTENPERVKDLTAAFGEHWILDRKEQKLLIYENQRASFLDAREAIEEGMQYDSIEIAEEIQKEQQKQRRIKENWVTYALVFVNLLVFFLLMLQGDQTSAKFMENHGALSMHLVGEGFWQYRMLTSLFMHFGIEHLVTNLFTLVVMGRYVERTMPKWKYLTIYLSSGLVGNLAATYYYLSHGQINVVCAGDSGAIFGLMGALLWLVISNHGQLGQLSWMQVVFMLLLCTYLGFSDTSISNVAHIGGAVGGFLTAMCLVREKDKEETVS